MIIIGDHYWNNNQTGDNCWHNRKEDKEQTKYIKKKLDDLEISGIKTHRQNNVLVKQAK